MQHVEPHATAEPDCSGDSDWGTRTKSSFVRNEDMMAMLDHIFSWTSRKLDKISGVGEDSRVRCGKLVETCRENKLKTPATVAAMWDHLSGIHSVSEMG